MGKLPSLHAPTRATLTSLTSKTTTHTHAPSSASQTPSLTRHANFIRRPRRPYTFTQLIQLSDGSSYTVRTTSPQALYKSAKDTRNTLLWNPSEKSLKNVELDEAGKLAAFRDRFGRAFDSKRDAGEEGVQEQQEEEEDDGGYGDLISSYAPDRSKEMKEAAPPVQVGKKKK
jgi:hypothetical protein